MYQLMFESYAGWEDSNPPDYEIYETLDDAIGLIRKEFKDYFRETLEPSKEWLDAVLDDLAKGDVVEIIPPTTLCYNSGKRLSIGYSQVHQVYDEDEHFFATRFKRIDGMADNDIQSVTDDLTDGCVMHSMTWDYRFKLTDIGAPRRLDTP